MSESQLWKEGDMRFRGHTRDHLPKIGRQAAKAAGQKWYWTGEPCKRGHTDFRLVSNHVCAACNKEASRRQSYKREYGASCVRKIDDLKLAREIARLERGE